MLIERNIWKLAIIKASKWLMLIMPILWLFYAENGLSIADLLIIQSIYSITIAVIEIPSGYIADWLGRRQALILGTFFTVMGMVVYSMSYGFEGFMFAALSLGVGQSFISGSDTALMYDTLLQLKRDKEFVKLEGRIVAIGNFAEAAAFVLGGLLASISLRTPFYIQIFIALTGFIAALSLVEPDFIKQQKARVKKGSSKQNLMQSWSNIKSIIRFALVENSILKHNLIFSAVIGAATLLMAWLSQPYLFSIGIEDVFYFGVIGAVLNLTLGLVSVYAHKIESKFEAHQLLKFILVVILGCYVLLGLTHTLWGLILLVVFYLTRGVATPILRDYLNRHTPSSMRATVLSLRSFVTRIIFSIGSPFLGYIADVYTIQQAFIAASIIFLTCCLWSFLFLVKADTVKKMS